MKLHDMFDYRSEFHSESEVKNCIKKSKKYEGEDPKEAKLLNFFITSRQITYLVLTDKAIYCILDNSKEEPLHLNWSESIDLFSDPKNIDKIVVTKDETPITGLVDFGSHSNWYYTKYLFEKKSIQQMLKEIIKDIRKKTA